MFWLDPKRGFVLFAYLCLNNDVALFMPQLICIGRLELGTVGYGDI